MAFLLIDFEGVTLLRVLHRNEISRPTFATFEQRSWTNRNILGILDEQVLTVKAASKLKKLRTN